MTAISGRTRFLVLDCILEPIIGVELLKEVFTSRVRWMSLIIEWSASANMFYLLKNLLLLILVIFKLMCDNLIFNEIMVLNALYVCLHAFLLHRESPDPDLGRRTPHFWGGSVTSIFVDEGLPGVDGDEDEALPSTSWPGPVPASTLEVEAPQATTSSTAVVEASWVEGEIISEQGAPFTFRRHIHLNKS
jgi:hypothetical protein